MVFCLRILSGIVMLSEGALAPLGVLQSSPLDVLHHLLGTLQAAEGSSHSTRRVDLMTSSSPCVLQQPL